MGKFLRTLLIGVGIGLLIAPKRGAETRQLLMERFQNLLALIGNSDSPITDRSSEQARALKNVARTAESHPMMNMSPTASYTPAYPEYVNPQTNPDNLG